MRLWSSSVLDYALSPSIGYTCGLLKAEKGVFLGDLLALIRQKQASLIDLPLIGGKYTWGNNRDEPTFVRLDRFLLSSDFEEAFPNIVQKLLNKSLSDHNAILLCEEVINWGPKPFRAFNFWCNEKGVGRLEGAVDISHIQFADDLLIFLWRRFLEELGGWDRLCLGFFFDRVLGTATRTFALACNKVGRISEFGSKGATGWCWSIHLRRNLFDWEQPQWNELLVCFQNFNFSSLDRDGVCWKGSSDDTFSVRSLRKIIDKNLRGDPIWKDIVWRGFAPPKVEIFMWQVIWNRVPVHTELILHRDPRYFSKPGMLQPKRARRNGWIFLVKLRIASWLLAKFPNDSVSVESLMADFSLATNLILYVNRESSKSGIGGLLRDESGMILMEFSEASSLSLLALVELEAINFGISNFLTTSWSLTHRLIVESDCKMVVDWINGMVEPPTIVANEVIETLKLMFAKGMCLKLIPSSFDSFKSVLLISVRKRTLEEALERRFAVAKAKLLQQKKNDKTFVEEDGKGTPRRNSSFLNTLIATSSNSSSKKGNFPFLGPSISQVF
ncbi:hypothetical protein V6N11_044571 [Hibiscus sabdariffa]|uniref:Reverse transcriptase zinc-binding domain-containing protein n=1 Tax=Hibiscus sabdariffa TaxID=183260 RepID=A0ABR2NBQ0_9ROSI